VRKTACLVALGLVVGLSSAAAPALAAGSPPSLSDIRGHWAEAEIRAAAASGWVNGYPDGSFRPDGEVTRAEFLKMLTVLGGSGGAGTDQRLAFFGERLGESGHWSAAQGYISSALARGVVEPSDYSITYTAAGGVDKWWLQPDTPMTRRDAAVLLTRAQGLKYEAEAANLYPGSRYGDAVPAPAVSFADAAALPVWARGWVATATARGLIQGYPDGTFQDSVRIKRSEAVIMLQRYSQTVRSTPNPLAQVKPATRSVMQAGEGLEFLNFIPVQKLTFDGADDLEWAAAPRVWGKLSRADRIAAVQAQTMAHWEAMRARDVAPLRLAGAWVSVEAGGQYLASGRYNGTDFEYYDINGMLDPASPETSSPILSTLAPEGDEFAAQMARAMDRAKVGIQSMGEILPTAVFTLPYPYLGDWFTLSTTATDQWARAQAKAYFDELKKAFDLLGEPLRAVRLWIAPADTADRAGQYQGLKVGETLLSNPVLAIKYDGRTFTDVERPFTLEAWLGGLAMAYEWVSAGEGYGIRREEPGEAAARMMMKSFVYTLGGMAPDLTDVSFRPLTGTRAQTEDPTLAQLGMAPMRYMIAADLGGTFHNPNPVMLVRNPQGAGGIAVVRMVRVGTELRAVVESGGDRSLSVLEMSSVGPGALPTHLVMVDTAGRELWRGPFQP